MNYFDIEFQYTGPYCNNPTDDEITRKAEEAYNLADKKVKEVLLGLGVQFRHAYGWPDGSLYKYVRTDKSEQELRELIKLDPPLYSISFYLAKEDEDPHKYNCKTLKEYFDMDVPDNFMPGKGKT